MPKDPIKEVLTKLQRATSAEKVQKHLRGLPDHNTVNTDGDTLLHSYVRRKDKHKKECLLAILVYGNCDVNKENKQGFTPLHIAAELNDVFSARALLAFGCEVNSLNPVNSTPLDIAQDLHREADIIDLLVSVGGQTGEVTTRDLYVLRTLRFEASCGSDWRPQGDLVKRQYSGDNHTDLGCSSSLPTALPVDPAEVQKEMERKKVKVLSMESIDGSDDEQQQFQRTAKVRFQTPDSSVTMGLTQASITEAKRREILHPLSPPVVEEGEKELTYHYQSCMKSHDVHSNGEETTPPDNELPYDDTDRAVPLGGDDELVDAVDFSPTPLEKESLRALQQIESGSLKAEGYEAWQQHRRERLTDSLQPMGSIKKSILCSLRKSVDGEVQVAGDVTQSLVRKCHVPEAFRVQAGEKVLCLDGGGVRGLVQLEILRHIEEMTHRRIVDLFDWIVGTSTGGILALGLVYANMTCNQLHQLYFEMKDRVFKNPTLGLACHTEELERILKERFSEEMTMAEKHKPRVLVCAVNKATTDLKLTFFNNCFNDEYSNELIWKVARYTSAAPIIFTECDDFVDGGLLASNPCSCALTKIQDFQRSNGGQLSCVVSVGCGLYPPTPIGNIDILSGKNILKAPWKLMNLLRLFKTALTGLEDASENCRCRCEQHNPPIQYFRFNPQLPESIESTETDGAKLCDLVVQAKQLLQNYDMRMDLLVQHFYYTAVKKRQV